MVDEANPSAGLIIGKNLREPNQIYIIPILKASNWLFDNLYSSFILRIFMFYSVRMFSVKANFYLNNSLFCGLVFSFNKKASKKNTCNFQDDCLAYKMFFDVL